MWLRARGTDVCIFTICVTGLSFVEFKAKSAKGMVPKGIGGNGWAPPIFSLMPYCTTPGPLDAKTKKYLPVWPFEK